MFIRLNLNPYQQSKMKNNLPIFCFSIVIVFLVVNCQKTYDKKLILDDWKVNVNNCPRSSHSESEQYLLQTSLPSTLHLDLLYHKKIQDPFFSNNWQSQKWISECNAFYQKNLTITDDMLKYQVINLVFEGIDTYSTIKLNSKQILRTQNAFVEYRVNVKDILKSGQNILQVQIVPTKSFDNRGQAQNNMPFPYAHSRKACYQYSWDWAPFMNTLGIWKDAYLQFYDEISIDYVWVQLQRLQESEALLKFSIKIRTHQQFGQFQKYNLVIQNDGQQSNHYAVRGLQNYLQLKISQPKLWWPNGIGEAHVYDFKVKLISGQKTIDEKNITYGIRTVRLDQTNNAFTVIVNGYKVYCKGANYVPPDMFYPRLTNKRYQSGNCIQNLLKDSVRSNFNMIRLWGGGQYQSDQFYELASRMGILIFSDFMFSDSIYPSNKQFLDNVEVQVVQQIRRVRNYPCLALWAGNNQILQGIQSWGWGSQKFKNDYKKLFQQHIQRIVQAQSPYIPYIPSSPVRGVGNGGFQKGGDVHYWGVWAAGAKFQSYQTAIGPFNSEFGTQALPVWQTIKQFTTENGRSYASKQLLSHERHNSQFRTLRKYMETYAKQSLSFQLQAYLSGLVQAYAIQIAIKAQRASKNNKSMGTLYWQLNDAWPGISWSAIDYYGRWKPLQYMAKNLYGNTIAFYHHLTGKVIAINDNLYDLKCFVQTKLISFTGQVYQKLNATVLLRENQAKYIFQLQKQALQMNASKVVVLSKLTLDNGEEIRLATFLRPLKDLQLPKCQLHVKFDLEENLILLGAKCLIKSLHIYHTSKYLSLSDNYIDIIPGQIHKTRLLTQDLKSINEQLKFRSYVQVYDKEELKVVFS